MSETAAALQARLFPHDLRNPQWLASAVRAFYNGVISGTIIRLPYFLNSLIQYAIYRDPRLWEGVRMSAKQIYYHGKNLGGFAFLYKVMCTIMRHFGLQNGLESLIAGFIASYYTAGRSGGVEGSVNYQIILYTLSRSVEALIVGAAENNLYPSEYSPRTAKGFKIFASVVLAVLLYLTDYKPSWFKANFYVTMDFLYYRSNNPSGSLIPPWNYAPIVGVILLTLSLGLIFKPLAAEPLLSLLDRIGPSLPARPAK